MTSDTDGWTPTELGAAAPATPAPSPAALRRTRSSGRRAWLALGLFIAWALTSRAIILADAWLHNPFARIPISDGATYWNWASDVAAGHLIRPTPFMLAPLYPYLLGALRALGGGLLAACVLQTVVHLLTALLLAVIGARRFSVAVGLTASGLFLLLTEPAFFAGRLLNCTFQMFGIAVLWPVLLRAQQRPAWSTWALAGGATGLNCLLNPPLLLAIPLLAIWAWWESSFRPRGIRHAMALTLAATVPILPATLHNLYTSREFIPVSANAGLTFAQGNTPRSIGLYTSLPGISRAQHLQNLDALRVFRQSTGQPGGWNATNAHFLRRGLDFWRTEPAAALRLILLKAYWFIAGQNGGDIYVPALELRQGLFPWLRLAPLPVPWLALPALFGLVTLALHPRRYAPELILFFVPALVVLLFFYTPRYRAPAVPVMTVLAAWVALRAAQWRTHRAWSAAAAAVFIVTLALGPINRAFAFDRPTHYRDDFHYELGEVLARLGKLDDAAAQYRQALEIHPGYALAITALGRLFLQQGQFEVAAGCLRDALRADPQNAQAHQLLGRALYAQNHLEEARHCFLTAVELNPDNVEFRVTLASAQLRLGDQAGARQNAEAALRLAPNDTDALLVLASALRQSGDLDGALRHVQAALCASPKLARSQVELAKILVALGERESALSALRLAQKLAPRDGTVARQLAWYLATLPDRPPDDRRAALTLARGLLASGDRSPELLDTLAAAFAANGRFPEAATAAQQALAQCTHETPAADVLELRQRLALYRAGRPYVLKDMSSPP